MRKVLARTDLPGRYSPGQGIHRVEGSCFWVWLQACISVQARLYTVSWEGSAIVASWVSLLNINAWDTWKVYDDVTPAFCALVSTPTLQTIEEYLEHLERFVVLRTSSQLGVNEARKQLFTQKGRTIDGLHPTQAALIQHIKRTAYQAGHCWAQMMIAAPELHHQVNGVG